MSIKTRTLNACSAHPATLQIDSVSNNNMPANTAPIKREDIRTLYTQLPSIDRLLREPAVIVLAETYGISRLTTLLRELQTQAREHIQQHQTLPQWCDNWSAALNQQLQQTSMAGMRRVFNLTGTVLHTNLGRARLAETAIEAVTHAMRDAVALEYDLDGAGRGHRDRAVADLICQLTGAEEACIVNNNAAAVLLLLASVAAGREVIVSRGELVEIGGAFRVPDVMRQAGCQLHEVGTTNRTHLRDYQQAINANTGLLMKVHASNYQISGFTAEVSHEQLAALGQQHAIPSAVDLGSGSLIDMSAYGLPPEPMPQQLIEQGIDLVTFSGDKLLGGPQAGIIIGKKSWIEQIQKHPLKRALRADKMTLAALEATLQLYLQPEHLPRTLPTLRLLTREQQAIKAEAERLQPALAAHYAEQFTVTHEACLSQIGSGSLPLDRLPSWALTFAPNDGRGSQLQALATRWRNLPQPVIGRIHDARLWLDLRCLEPDQEQALLEALTA